MAFTEQEAEANNSGFLNATFDIPEVDFMSPHVIPMLDNEEFLSFLSSLDIQPMSEKMVTTKKMKKKRTFSSRASLGICKHPKHTVYRQLPTKQLSTPRRGRPPKGTKAAELHLSKTPLTLEMTVRPLPKRLEPVVGQKDIRVCLTCLKRTDMDPAYTSHPFYVKPQAAKQRRR
ncbi:hypothetical protein EC973_009242 [Apophysomyces ossiformis]|uniref:Uncharacterized protein n=1 Tax=Apophysomyces ossiformis TaxID=679940 RepID=A0A8H7EQF3_9FUNG|nr:hypothetical protein EC973_009242 [Apophysomyces ossiformis]